MIRVSDLLCGHEIGIEPRRYGQVGDNATGQDGNDEVAAFGTRNGAGTLSISNSFPRSRPSLFPAAPRPIVEWAVTRASNLRCTQCDEPAIPSAADGELTFEEGIALLDDLRAFDVPEVLFSGGEPLMRPDTPDLITYAQSIGLSAALSTNGLLIDDAMADRLAGLGLMHAEISLEGAKPRHDAFCGIKGAFNETLAAIDLCRERGIDVVLRFTVNAKNSEDLDEIFQICFDHDVQRLCIYHLAPAGLDGKKQEADLSAFDTRRVVGRIFRLTAKFHEEDRPLEVVTIGNHADAGYLVLQLERIDRKWADRVEGKLIRSGGNRSGCNIASIDPIGNVHYDQFSWRYNCGNVREQRFSRIWGEPFDERLQILRDRWSYLPVRCRACRFVPVCNGNLRTRAEAATGDWLGVDPNCYISGVERLST